MNVRTPSDDGDVCAEERSARRKLHGRTQHAQTRTRQRNLCKIVRDLRLGGAARRDLRRTARSLAALVDRKMPTCVPGDHEGGHLPLSSAMRGSLSFAQEGFQVGRL